jgi:hypothetical protein
MLAPWVGGAASPTEETAGYRSMLAPWIGGAASPSEEAAGYRSMVAFWMGGACAPSSTPVPTPSENRGAYPNKRHQEAQLRYDQAQRKKRRRQREDEEILLLLSVIVPEIIDRQ